MTLSGSGTDAGAADAGARDAGAVDAGAVDAGGRDGGAGGGVDGGADAGVPRSDAGADAGPARDGGCTLAFAPVTRQPGGGSFLVSSDFDRDGRPDLAWTNPFADELGVVLNSMTGLQPVVRTRFAAGAWPSALAVADVDLDGFDDLVVGALDRKSVV